MIKETLNIQAYEKWILTIAYLVLSLVGLYFTPLFDEDEGFFAEAARNMLQSQDFITISVNGEQRYDKPALFFWITAASLKTFGINELGARLPSFLFFVLTLVSLYFFCLKHFTKRNGELAVVVASSILQFQVLARATVSDNLLNLLVGLALFSFYNFLQKPNNRSLFGLYTCAGLGFLTKGPVAFVVIFGVITVYLLITRNYKIFLKILNPVFVLWAILIPLPWFYFAFEKSGDFLFTDFFIKHNLGRYSQTMESHGGVLWYYFPVLFLSFIPFSHLIFSALRNFNRENLFLIVWFLVPFVLFSFSKTQLPHYISIGYLPLIILMTQTKNLNSKAIFLQIVLLLILLIAAPLAIKYIPINDKFVVEMLKYSPKIFDSIYFIVMILVLTAICLLYFRRKQNMVYILGLYAVGTLFFIHRFAMLQQGFVKEVGKKLKNTTTTVFMKDHYNPSLSFYAKRVFSIKSDFAAGDMVFSKFPYESTDSLILSGNGFGLILK